MTPKRARVSVTSLSFTLSMKQHAIVVHFLYLLSEHICLIGVCLHDYERIDTKKIRIKPFMGHGASRDHMLPKECS
jgi:hypothetical protein